MALYSSPKAQDFATGATQDVNLARSNVKGPTGSVTWMPPTTPGGQWTQTTTLNPNEQKTLTGTETTSGNLAAGAAAKTPWAVGLQSGPMDYSKFMAGGSRVNGGAYYDKAAGDAVYNQFSSRMEPEFSRQTAQMDTQLRNQGLKPGDEAYDNQMKQVAQEQGDQRERARQDAVQMAGQEGARMQGMDVSAGNYNTNQRVAQITQELQRRGYGVEEIKQMLAGTGVNMPTGQNGPIGSTYSDAMARTYGEDANAAKDKNASTGSWLNLATKVGEPLLNKAGGYIANKVGSWLGFNPAGGGAASGVTGTAGGVVSDLAQGKSLGTTAKDAVVNYGENAAKGYVKDAVAKYGANAAANAAADAAGAAGLETLGTGQVAGDIASAYSAAAPGIEAGINGGLADAAAQGGTAAATSGGGAGAGSAVGATLGGVAAAVGAGIALKHLSDNAAGLGYRESRQLAAGIAQNANNPDPKFGKGKYAGQPMQPAPPGFKTWNQYFYVTQMIQQSMHATGGKKDQGTYKMLLQEAGVPTDISYYTQVHPGQEMAWQTIMGPKGVGTPSGFTRGR